MPIIYPYRVATTKRHGNIAILTLIPVNEANRISSFTPGQHLVLTVFNEFKVKLGSRPFTIISLPNEDGRIELAIKIYQGFTKHIEELKPNDLVELSSPIAGWANDFFSHENIVCLAGGTGITPFLCLARELAAKNLPNQLLVINSNKKRADIIQEQELNELSEQHPNFQILETLTEETPATWLGALGRIDAKMISQFASPLKNKTFYLCGPKSFIVAMKETLEELNVLPEKIIFPNL